jgi:hypothetical protein
MHTLAISVTVVDTIPFIVVTIIVGGGIDMDEVSVVDEPSKARTVALLPDPGFEHKTPNLLCVDIESEYGMGSTVDFSNRRILYNSANWWLYSGVIDAEYSAR